MDPNARFGNINFGSGYLFGDTTFTLGNIYETLISLAFGIGIATTISFVIICGVKITMSGGDQSKLAESRNCLMWAVLATVGLIAFRLVINFALTALGLTTTIEGELAP